MNNIITIKNVRAYLDENGIAQINLEDTARGLGFTRFATSGNEVIRWERVDKYLADFGFMPTSGHDGFIPENIFYRLAMKAKVDEVAYEEWYAKHIGVTVPTMPHCKPKPEKKKRRTFGGPPDFSDIKFVYRGKDA